MTQAAMNPDVDCLFNMPVEDNGLERKSFDLALIYELVVSTLLFHSYSLKSPGQASDPLCSAT